jgi:predicted PurR-regulated permease PerM
MKKFTLTFLTAIMLLIMSPAQAKETTSAAPTTTTLTAEESAKVTALVNRVNEINAMDRSSMSRSEKKALRNELRSIKREVNKTQGSVVYISSGLLILIIVLIILL